MIYPVAYQRMMEWSNKHDEQKGIPEVWQTNARKNIEYFDAHPEKVIGSIHKMPKYEGKAVVVVGRGKSLDKAIDMFKDADDRFIIVATNSSLRILLDHGIVPQYMILIDGENTGNWSLSDLPKEAEQVTALFAVGAHHESVAKWPGKIMVVPYGIKHGELQKEIRRRWGKSIAAGGNAFNGAVAIFLMNTLVRIYAFVGNNLSFKEGETFYYDKETERDDKAYWVMHDIYGEECYTDIPMYEYKVWLEQACSQFFPDCYFVNCSEGILGVDTDNTILPVFDHMPLDMAIGRIKDALDFENKPTIERYRAFYQMLYDRGDYKPTNSMFVWEQIQEELEKGARRRFKKALDVGCGPGWGVHRMTLAGYNITGLDIARIPKWEELGISDKCLVSPAHQMPFSDNEFDFIYCGDMLEHVPEEYIEDTLKEMYRVGSKDFLFVICCALEERPIDEIVYTHVSVKNHEEWTNLLETVGYKIIRIEVHNEGEHSVFHLKKESE